METHQKFLEFNGKNIVFLNVDGIYYIALKPICEALNVVYTGQLKRIKKHQILAPALHKCTMQVPISSKKNVSAFQGREMLTLPEKYIYGWIFSINSTKPELLKYQKTCYELLYNHFHGTITNRKELLIERKTIDTKIHSLKQELKEQDQDFKDLQLLLSKRKKLSSQLNTMDKELVKQPELFN